MINDRKSFYSFRGLRTPQPRGSVLILAMGITVVLTGIVLVFARQMRVEALISGNLQSGLQANTIIDGAARHIVNQLANNTDRMQLDLTIQSQGVPIGNGRYWIVRPNATDERQYDYGIVDESSKLNINFASQDELSLLPNIPADLAASIVNWRNPPNKIAPGGAESEDYLLLPDPYNCKNASFETLNELQLVKGATPDVLYGADANRNGVVDADESANVQSLSGINGQTGCGIYKYLTVYGTIPNTAKDGTPRLFVGDTSRQTLTAVTNLLNKRLGAANTPAIINRLRQRPPARNVLDFYEKSGMSINNFKQISDYITTVQGKVLRGLVNINTAPREVLMCLPGLTSSDVDAIFATRSSNSPDLDNIAWVAQALPSSKAARIGGSITTRSYQYSADIVAVGENGRDFQRFKFVFDMRTTPPSIIYRKDMTYLGWPLSPDILQSLSSGAADNKPSQNMPKMGQQ
jgi:type II secretory pathway component PulK